MRRSLPLAVACWLWSCSLLAQEPPRQCADAASSANARVRVMVLELKGDAAMASSLRSLTQVVAEQAARVEGYQIVSAEEIRAVLDQEATKQMLGCDDSSCLAELAGALDAELLISGLVETTPDGAPVLTLSLLNTKALVTVNRVSLTWRGDKDRLPDVAAAAAQRLVFEREQRVPGAVAITGLPEGGHVVVDDVDRTGDGLAIANLEAGPHEIRMMAEGFEPKTAYVLIGPGQTANVDGALEDSPLWTRWWFWTGTGAAVVASVGATVAVLTMTAPSNANVNGDVRVPALADMEQVKR